MVDDLGHCCLMSACSCLVFETVAPGEMVPLAFDQRAFSVYKKFAQEVVYNLLQCSPKLPSFLSDAYRVYDLWLKL